jgi:predicted GIY-YIG superfamily endonuclease
MGKKKTKLKDVLSKLALIMRGDPFDEHVKPAEWSIYFLRCSDGSIYTGIAKDVQKRLSQHNRRRGAKYTSSRLPVYLEAQSPVGSQSEALKLEYAVKRLSRERKLCLIKHIVRL